MNIYGGKNGNVINQQKEESEQTLRKNLDLDNNKNQKENNQNKYEKISCTLNVEKNEKNGRKANFTRLRKNFEGSSSNSQEENNEKKMFKFVANKVDNDNDYANLSFLKDDVKQFQQSCSSIYS